MTVEKLNSAEQFNNTKNHKGVDDHMISMPTNCPHCGGTQIQPASVAYEQGKIPPEEKYRLQPPQQRKPVHMGWVAWGVSIFILLVFFPVGIFCCVASACTFNRLSQEYQKKLEAAREESMRLQNDYNRHFYCFECCKIFKI